MSLSSFPLANPDIITQLMNLADEDLPPEVKDAIFQIIDAVEKRIRAAGR